MTTVRAAARVLVALCVATTGLLLPAPAATAAETCVGVVVDGRLLGGEVRTGCAKGDPSSGLKALSAAGFGYAFAPRQPGLVCQVDGVPACDRTTTTDYWSYWYRPAGSDTWVYASEGAGSHDPEPGSTEAWVWQEGGRRTPPAIAQSTICPVASPSPRATRPAKASPGPGRTKPGTTTPAAESSAAPRTTDKAARSAEPPATAAPSGSTTPSATTPTATTPTTSRPPATPAATPAAASSAGDDGGGPRWLGVAVGLALVAALGGAALVRSRRSGP